MGVWTLCGVAVIMIIKEEVIEAKDLKIGDVIIRNDALLNVIDLTEDKVLFKFHDHLSNTSGLTNIQRNSKQVRKVIIK